MSFDNNDNFITCIKISVIYIILIYSQISRPGHVYQWYFKDSRLQMFISLSGFSDKDLDDIRSLFTEVNMYLLALTFAISIFHVSHMMYMSFGWD